jgi:gentisate 1,2-dioxygenase
MIPTARDDIHVHTQGVPTASHRRCLVSCLLEGLPAGTRSRPSRETASSVLVVARGTGTLVCGRKSFELLPRDVAAIPAWTWHQITAGDHDLVLFRVTDRPVHEAFGLYRGETAPGIAP